MKKILATALSALLIAGLCTGCRGGMTNDTNPGTSQSTTASTSRPTETTRPSESTIPGGTDNSGTGGLLPDTDGDSDGTTGRHRHRPMPHS